MIHKKNDILFTLITLVAILTIGVFLGRKVASEVNRPAILIDGTYDPAMASKKPVKDLDDYIAASDDVAVTKADPVLSEAARLREEGYLDAAMSMLERVHSQNPTNEEAMNTLVSAYIASEQLLKAEQMLSQLLELDPQNARIHYNFGVVKSMQGESASAVAAYTKALSLNPVYTRAHYNMGMIHLKMDSLEKAEEHFRAITRCDHSAESAKAYFQLGYVLSRQSGRTQDAIAAYRQATVLKPDYIEARNNLAIQLEKDDDKDGAIAELEKAVQLDPSAAGSLYNLGRLYSDTDRLDEAANNYRLASRADPALTKAFFNLGVVEEKRDESLKAIDAYESLLTIEPEHLRAIIRLGVLYRRANKPKNAEKYLKRALSIDPKYASAWNSLGVLYANQNRYEEALKHYNEAIRLDPESVPAQFNKALALENLKRDKEAAGVYNDILKKDTGYLRSRCQLVKLYARKGDFKKVTNQVVKLEKLAPDDPQALAAVSSAYLSMGLPDEALVRQEKLTELRPDDISVWVTLGEIYDRMGWYAEAVEAYKSASSQDPTDITLLKAIGKAYENNVDPNQAEVYFDKARELETAGLAP